MAANQMSGVSSSTPDTPLAPPLLCVFSMKFLVRWRVIAIHDSPTGIITTILTSLHLQVFPHSLFLPALCLSVHVEGVDMSVGPGGTFG